MSTNTNEITYTHILDAMKNCGGNEPTLKAIALALNIPATRLYAMAKKPIPGQVYDPTVTNWDKISQYIAEKLVEGIEGLTTMEDVIKSAYEKDELLKANAVRSTPGANLIDVDGVQMPKRKAAMFEMGNEAESLVCFKHDSAVYKMVYQTMGYTVIRPVNEDGSFAKEEIRLVSNSTLNTKCVAPGEMAQAIADRFSGVYVDSTAPAVETETAAE